MPEPLIEMFNASFPDFVNDLGLKVVRRDYRPEQFGDSLVVFSYKDVLLTFARDRGELEASVALKKAPDDYWDVELIAQVLGNVDSVDKFRKRTATDFAFLVNFVWTNFHRIVVLFASSQRQSTLAQLRKFQDDRLKRLLGKNGS